MQLRTLPECNRLYEQQMQQQEQISLEVLDQVQESLSLLQTLYRSRMSPVTSASNGEQAYGEGHRQQSTERLQHTGTHKTNGELENQRQNARQQDLRDTSSRAHHKREEQEERVSYDGREIVKVSSQKNACRLVPDGDVASAARKTTVLQQSGLKRSSSKEHTLWTQQQRANGCGQVQPCSKGHGKQPHSGAEQAYVPTASSRPPSAGNDNDSINEDTLHTATHEPPSISLRSPIAAVSDDTKIVCTALRDAARAGSFFRSLEGRSSTPPSGSRAIIPSDELRDGRLARQTCTRRDMECPVNLPVCLSNRGTSPPGCQRANSPSPSSQLLPCRSMKCEEKWISCQRPPLGSVSATTVSQHGNRISDFLTQAPASAAAGTFAPSDENASRCKSKWRLVTASFEPMAEYVYNVTPTRQNRQLSGDLHERNYCSCCIGQCKAIWNGNSKQGDGKTSAAPAAVRINHLDINDVKSQEVQGGDCSTQNQRLGSAVEAPSPNTDPSTQCFHPTAGSGVTTCLPSDPVAMNEVVDHRYNPHRAATSKAAKPPFPQETTAVDACGRTDTDGDTASFVASETSVDYAAQEIPCAEAHCEVATPRTMAVLTSPAYCWESWNENNVLFCEKVGTKSALRPPDTFLSASESCRTETKTEVADEDFPLQLGPTHQEEGGSEDQQIGSHSRRRKPGHDKNGHWSYTRGKAPPHQTPQRPSMRIAADDVHYWEGSQPQGFSKPLPRHVRSPSRKTVLPPTFRMSSLQRSARKTEPHGPHSPQIEPPCAILLHCPYRGYAIVRPNRVVGTGEETSSPSASPLTPEKQRAASRCVTGTPEASGVLFRRASNHVKKDVDNLCASTVPSSSPSTCALPCSQKRLCALSVPSPPSLASQSTPHPPNDVLATHFFKSCYYRSQQPEALLDKVRRMRRCSRRLSSPSSLRNGRCLAAAAASKSLIPTKEVSPLLAQERGSERDDTSTPRIDCNAASGGNHLATVVVGKEIREPVALVTAAASKNTASSRVPASSLPRLLPVRANEEPEYRTPLFYADSSRPLLVSAAHGTTDIASLSASPSRTHVSLSRHSGQPACTEASHAANCVVCYHPLDCSALPETVAQPILHAGQTEHTFYAHESVPQSACVRTVQQHPQGIRCNFRGKEDRGIFCSPRRSEIHLCCGAQNELPERELQMPLTSEASNYNCRCRYSEQLQAHTFADYTSEINNPIAAGHSRAQLIRWGSSNICATPAKQIRSANTNVMSEANTPGEARLHNHLGTSRRQTPFVQPARPIGVHVHRLRSAPVSIANVGVCHIPSSNANEASAHGATSATIPSDCGASQPDAEQSRVPRRQTSAILLQTHPLRPAESPNHEHRRQPPKASTNQVSLQQQHPHQQCQQEQSQLVFPLMYYGRNRYLCSDPKVTSGNFWEPKESFPCKRTEDVYEETQGHEFLQRKPPKVFAPACGFTCCSAVQQEMNSQQRHSPLSDTSEAKDELSFSVKSGVGRTEISDCTSRRSSVRRLSTASTHAEDAASPKFFPSPSVGMYGNKVRRTHPQKHKTKRQVSEGSRDADVYGSTTLNDTLRQRKATITGEHPEQVYLRLEVNDTSAQVVGKPTHSPHVAAQRRFALVPHHRCEPARLLTRSSSACSAYVMISHKELDGAVSREISNENCQSVVAETPEGATQTENSAEKHEWGSPVKKPHETGDCSSIKSQSRQGRKVLLSSHGEKYPHPAKKLVPQVVGAKGVCCADEQNSPERPGYHQLAALVHPECAPAAVVEATKPPASLPSSSFIFRIAAAEAAAILRNEG